MRKYIARLVCCFALFGGIPQPAHSSVTYVYQFEPTSIVGPMPIPFIWLSEAAFLAGGSSGANYFHLNSPTSGLELLSFPGFLSFTDATLQADRSELQIDFYTLTVVGDYLAGSFRTGNGDFLQTQGMSVGIDWAIGEGGDGGSCYGSADPSLIYYNQCRATGRFHFVGTIPEPAAAAILSVALLLLYAFRRADLGAHRFRRRQ